MKIETLALIASVLAILIMVGGMVWVLYKVTKEF